MLCAVFGFSPPPAGGVDAPVVTLNNGVKMPAVSAGTWQYNTSIAQDSVAAALRVGFRHIDTAHDYCSDGSTGGGGFSTPGCASGSVSALRLELLTGRLADLLADLLV